MTDIQRMTASMHLDTQGGKCEESYSQGAAGNLSPTSIKQQIWFTASFCLALGLLSLNQLQHRATVLGLEQLLN